MPTERATACQRAANNATSIAFTASMAQPTPGSNALRCNQTVRTSTRLTTISTSAAATAKRVAGVMSIEAVLRNRLLIGVRSGERVDCGDDVIQRVLPCP